MPGSDARVVDEKDVHAQHPCTTGYGRAIIEWPPKSNMLYIGFSPGSTFAPLPSKVSLLVFLMHALAACTCFVASSTCRRSLRQDVDSDEDMALQRAAS